MSQLNIHLTQDFERALKRLMRLRGIASKSEAVRIAVQEAAERAAPVPMRVSFAQLRGIGVRGPVNATPRFKSDDDLWRKDGR